MIFWIFWNCWSSFCLSFLPAFDFVMSRPRSIKFDLNLLYFSKTLIYVFPSKTNITSILLAILKGSFGHGLTFGHIITIGFGIIEIESIHWPLTRLAQVHFGHVYIFVGVICYTTNLDKLFKFSFSQFYQPQIWKWANLVLHRGITLSIWIGHVAKWDAIFASFVHCCLLFVVLFRHFLNI